MKKIILISSVILLIFSCNSYKRNRFEYHLGNKKNEWINNFKTEFFFSCLNKGYKSDSIANLISKKDLLYLYEPFAYQHEQVDSISSLIIEKMPKPIYAHNDEINYKKELDKNYICASCLNYYSSRELDSIAKRKYKLSQKK